MRQRSRSFYGPPVPVPSRRAALRTYALVSINPRQRSLDGPSPNMLRLCPSASAGRVRFQGVGVGSRGTPPRDGQRLESR
jgi:hypothetical protein